MQKNKTKTLKRMLACVMVIIMALTAVPLGHFAGLEHGIKASARELTEGYYTYTVENGEATITKVNTSISGEVAVPSKLGGYPVKNIGYASFEECKNITGISLGNSIVTIDHFAFFMCENLKSVKIGENVISIGNEAFRYCEKLESIMIPGSVTSIGERVFEACNSLSDIQVDLSNSAYSSVDGVLLNKTKTLIIQYPIANQRTEYEIPVGVETIGFRSFNGCHNLSKKSIS